MKNNILYKVQGLFIIRGLILIIKFIIVGDLAFITYGHHAFIAGKRVFTINSFFMTVVLAVVFTLFQYIEYTDSSFSISDSVFGTTFYASTGLLSVMGKR